MNPWIKRCWEIGCTGKAKMIISSSVCRRLSPQYWWLLRFCTVRFQCAQQEIMQYTFIQNIIHKYSNLLTISCGEKVANNPPNKGNACVMVQMEKGYLPQVSSQEHYYLSSIHSNYEQNLWDLSTDHEDEEACPVSRFATMRYNNTDDTPNFSNHI